MPIQGEKGSKSIWEIPVHFKCRTSLSKCLSVLILPLSHLPRQTQTRKQLFPNTWTNVAIDEDDPCGLREFDQGSLHLCPSLAFYALSGSLGSRRGNVFIKVAERKSHPLWIIKSVLGNGKSNVHRNGGTEPARILLERLFAHTQKLEEQMAALDALKKKEEHLQDAERKILSEHAELNQAREKLVRREEEIVAACSKHEKLEDEMKQANLKLASQATQLEDLKLRLKERDENIFSAQSALALKEDEMNKLKIEWMKNSEAAATVESELKSKARLLDEVNEIMKKQEGELQQLRKAIQEKEEEEEVSATMRELEKEKLKVAEANLEKKTMEWLIAKDELKKLAEEASRHTAEANETLEDFKRVKKLLADVRSELVASQKALASSRQRMEDQKHLLEKQLIELEEQRRSVKLYMTSLKNAQIEVESKIVKLRVVEARNKELERDLCIEKELIERLQEELNKERSSLKQVIEEKSFLQEELDCECTKFKETQSLLQVKESEIVDARLEIQRLKSEKASLQLMLEDKDSELFNVRKKLEEVNLETAAVRTLMNSREDELIQATSMLEEKEKYVQGIEHELSNTKLKYSEAESVVEQITELTNKLVILVNNDDFEGLNSDDDILKNSTDNFKWKKKQLETELELTRESLRTKDMEVLATQRALTIKDEELKMVRGRLDAREKELETMKEETIRDANDLKQLYALAQERIGERSIGDLAIEKLQIEAAQLEVESATCASTRNLPI
ncbi:myosin heavy chain-related protein [Actinidia rufa]|uniref:Myosin heavy chain-related protein n=1 Tax=Actinidia rufa TaxID=165716 RepID=A0A7J0GC23_9ERIC|nr:myosin heavy chain-related protein [Actinidia rufa]